MIRKGIGIMILTLVMVLPAAAVASQGGVHWGYEGKEGPANWGDLSHDYAACKDGREQSPIDISSTLSAAVGGLEFHYSPTSVKVLNNGHAIQVNYNSGSYMIVGGERYDLLQFHFHSPSENIFRGRPFAMEVHLVHKNAKGELAVVGIFLDESIANGVLGPVWDVMPSKGGLEQPGSGSISASDLLPADKSFYHFMGSLTTPPCSENVKWYVMKDTISVGNAQVQQFLNIVGNNARPAQPQNGRNVVGVSVGSGGGH